MKKLIVCLTTIVPVWGSAQVDLTQNIELHGLDGSPEYQASIVAGVNLWQKSADAVLRQLMIGRCKVEIKDFPAKPAPIVVKLINSLSEEFVAASKGKPSDDPWIDILRSYKTTASILVREKFTADQIAEWNTFRASESGRRYLKLYEMTSAIEKASEAAIDDRSGRAWVWPVVRLYEFSEKIGIGDLFYVVADKALSTPPGRLKKISSVPGEESRFDYLGQVFFNKSVDIKNSFVENLSVNDKNFMAALSAQKLHTEGRDLIEKLPSIMYKAVYGKNANVDSMVLCDSLDVKNCGVSSASVAALDKLRSDFTITSQTLPFQKSLSRIVKNAPEAGCP